jgi:integrase
MARLVVAGDRLTFYGRTRSEVSKNLLHARVEHEGRTAPISKLTVAQFLVLWLDTNRATWKQAHHRYCEKYVRVHIIPTLGTTPLSKLSRQQVQNLITEKQKTQISSTTVRHIHAVLHAALEQAVAWETLPKNVADHVVLPRAAQTDIRPFSGEHVRQFLEAVAGERLEALFEIAIATGMRQGELLALRWQDIDLKKAQAHIRGTIQPDMTVAQPKTRASQRTVALTEEAVASLKRHRSRQNEERLALGASWEPSDIVFSDEAGRTYNPTRLLRQFKRVLKEHGLPDLRFHDLRHTYATLMLNAGIHPKVVSETLGHSRIQTTLDLYSHVTPNMQRGAAEAMQSVMHPVAR